MSENKPYYCTKCKLKHYKGKIYADHKVYKVEVPAANAIKGGKIDEATLDKAILDTATIKSTIEKITPGKWNDVTVKFEENAKGEMACKVAVDGKEAKAKVVVAPERKVLVPGAWPSVKELDRFLITASKKQLRLLLEECPSVAGVKGGANSTWKANWRAAAWEGKDGSRIPFSIEEMIKYRPMIDKANKKRPGIFAGKRAKKALRMATEP